MMSEHEMQKVQTQRQLCPPFAETELLLTWVMYLALVKNSDHLHIHHVSDKSELIITWMFPHTSIKPTYY